MVFIEFKLDDKDFPLLNKIKQENLNDYLLQIFQTGYNIHFPSNDKIEKNVEYNTILERIESKNSEVTNKMVSLETSLSKLIGISSNSSRKGNFGENFLEELFNTRYGDIQFIRKSSVAHSGDAWLYLPDGQIIILESKNYTSTVNKDEILKLQSDMITHHIKWGILISFNSMIIGMKELDFHTFTHNNETYSIIMISQMSTDIHKLDLGLQIIRKLITILNGNCKFPWIVYNVNQNLTELNQIVQKNYLLRDSFYNMERDITKALSSYHVILRDYQYEIEKKINDIISNVKTTIDNSIKLVNGNNYNDIIQKYTDKKILPLIVRFVDIVQYKNWNIIFDDELNEWIVSNNMEEIGKLKVQLKKMIFTTVNDININLQLDKEKENRNNLEIIKLL